MTSRLAPFALRTLVIASAALLLGGCAATGAPGAESAVGVWEADAASHGAYLELAEDGTLSGTDGCNRLMGEWDQNGATVSFGPIASTMMACEGVETWLGGAISASVDGKIMTVLDDSGQSIGTLIAQ
ncbi:META domain-containing protein [Glaciibacter superstes]|uniref:META domain-containing protein n=1 Tax=Glaciibacter superstes TaxID=501023 RepID=UPI00052451CD|nr:META domain-containing protein [Glaciibacter superstes]